MTKKTKSGFQFGAAHFGRHIPHPLRQPIVKSQVQKISSLAGIKGAGDHRNITLVEENLVIKTEAQLNVKGPIFFIIETNLLEVGLDFPISAVFGSIPFDDPVFRFF